MTDRTDRFFWAHVDKTATCWLWHGEVLRNGYGLAYLGRAPGRRLVRRLAHRLSYELAVGPIPKGLQIDHLCRVRNCVNPAHLEAVTPRVNVLRGDTITARNASKTACPRGHPYDEANTCRTLRGRRRCRTCARDDTRRRRACAVVSSAA
jgi:hypothetical protein